MVHFPTLSSTAYVFSGGFSRISQRGFPHSDIPGSKPICGSPGLIAAYRVLHRLLMPRHSPYTLSSLTIRNSNLHLQASDFRLRAAGTCVPGTRGPEPRTCMRKFYAHCVCVVGKKLPFAEYSVVKELARLQALGSRPWPDHASDEILFSRLEPEAQSLKQSGEYRSRTGDLLVANQALSQLS